jgi:hypothetical protein
MDMNSALRSVQTSLQGAIDTVKGLSKKELGSIAFSAASTLCDATSQALGSARDGSVKLLGKMANCPTLEKARSSIGEGISAALTRMPSQLSFAAAGLLFSSAATHLKKGVDDVKVNVGAVLKNAFTAVNNCMPEKTAKTSEAQMREKLMSKDEGEARQGSLGKGQSLIYQPGFNLRYVANNEMKQAPAYKLATEDGNITFHFRSNTSILVVNDNDDPDNLVHDEGLQGGKFSSLEAFIKQNGLDLDLKNMILPQP